MSELLFQIASVVSLIAGVIAAEAITYRIFGKPKSIVAMLDIVLFVVLATVLFSFFKFSELNYLLYGANFLIGLFSIVVIRAFEASFGLTEKVSGQDNIIVNVIRSLARAGFNKDEIRSILKRSGYSPSVLDRYDNLVETGVPPFVQKFAKVEDDVEETRRLLEEQGREMSQLKASLTELRLNDLDEIKKKLVGARVPRFKRSKSVKKPAARTGGKKKAKKSARK